MRSWTRHDSAMSSVPEGPALDDPSTREAVADYGRGASRCLVLGVAATVVIVVIGLATRALDNDITFRLWVYPFAISAVAAGGGAGALIRSRRVQARLQRCAWQPSASQVFARGGVLLGGTSETPVAMGISTWKWRLSRLMGADVLWVAGDPHHQWVVVARPGPGELYVATRWPWRRAKRASALVERWLVRG
jgi:hypothetical protein